MTAENEVPEVRKVEIEDKCEDLTNVGGDCNVKKLIEDEGEPEGAKLNSNGAGKDDSDGSYVFVSRSDDSVNGDPVDLSLEDGQESPTREYSVNSLTKGIEQVGELNDESRESASDEVKGTDDSAVVKATADDADNFVLQDQTAVNVEFEQVDTEGAVKEQIVPDLAPKSEEILDTEGVMEDQSAKINELEQLDAEAAVKEQTVPDLEKLDAEVAVKEQTVPDLAPKSIQLEQLDAEVAVKEQIVPDLAPEHEENLDAQSGVEEQIVSDLVPEKEENLEPPVGIDDGEMEPEGQTPASETTSETEKVSESAKQAVSESTSRVEEVEGKMEPEGFSANSVLISEELKKISVTVGQDCPESTAKLVETTECPAVVLEVGDHQDGEQNIQEEKNIESALHPQESEKAEDLVSEAFECQSSLVDDDFTKVVKEDEAIPKISSGLECAETPDIVSDSTEFEHSSFQLEKVIEEKESFPEGRTDLEQDSESKISGQESSEVESSQLNDGEGKLVGEEEDMVSNTKGSQSAIDDEIIVDADHGSGAGQVASVPDLPLETEIANELDVENNEDSNPTSQVEKSISLPEVQNEPVTESQDSSAFIDSPDCAENLPSSKITSAEGVQTCHVTDGEVSKPEKEKKPDAGINIKESSSRDCTIIDASGVEAEGSEPAELAHLEGLPVGTEMANEDVLNQNEDSFPTSQDASVSTGSINNDETARSSTDNKCSEIEVKSDSLENFLPSSRIDAEVKNTKVGGDGLSQSCDSATNIEVNVVDAEDEVTGLDGTEAAVTNSTCSQSLPDDGLHPEGHTNKSLQSGSSAELGPEVNDPEMPGEEALEVLDDTEPQVSPGGAKEKVSLTSQVKDDEKLLHPEEISASSLEVASGSALDEQCAADVVLQKPFNYLIKLPRYDDDDNLREQIRLAQLQVDEKTKQRDAIRPEVQKIKANCQKLFDIYEAAKSEGKATRLLISSKRQEIDSVQNIINRVKNAISIDEIDVRLRSMEQMLQHTTLHLKEEKQVIREMKQMRQLREQLSFSIGNQDEVRQARENRDQIEDQLKVLKKELESLKATAANAEATAKNAEKTCQGDSEKLKELHLKFKALDNQRQEAYVRVQNLKRKFYEKNSGFRRYKDDAAKANDMALSGNYEALYTHCFKQVDDVMDLWNKNEEFRNEYIRCNTRSTLRRFRTLDARALGPDEESPVIPGGMDERTDRSISTPGKADSVLVVPNVDRGKQVVNVAVEVNEKDVKTDKSKQKVVEPLRRSEDIIRPSKPAPSVVPAEEASASAASEEMAEEVKKREEEEEKARKEEMLRKEEEAAKLKEQRRLEEIAKAKEALERKRRNAEKAQIRAQLRAQREAEEKEKEKEKRARKKGKKKGAAGESADGDSEREIVPVPESAVSATKEPEVKKEAPKPVTKRPNQFTKPKATIPPPLRNRNKKKMQQYLWMALAVAAVIAVFFMGNIGIYANFGKNLRMKPPGY